MELLSLRFPTRKETTLGQLFVNGELVCFTLEDAVREVNGEPVEKWKKSGITAIPQGKYKVTLENSPRFGSDTPTINNVSGYSEVRAHKGNKAADTEGCIILGMGIELQDELGGDIVGGTSAPAFERVRGKIKNAVLCGEEVWWTIKNQENSNG